MKYILILFLITATLICNGQKSIEGTWLLDINETIVKMNSSQKSDFEKIPESERNRIRQNFAQRIFTFKPNGIFEAQWFDGSITQQNTGTWSASAETITISITNSITVYNIRDLGAHKLVLEKTGGNEGLFKTLSFNRQ